MPPTHEHTTHEQRRLNALRRLHLMDSEPEERFDRICRIASRLLGTPIAYISLLDDARQFFKSAVGLPDVKETPKEHSFCKFTIDGRLALYVPDAANDQRFHTNPYVTGPPGVRCYLGEPLFTCDGYAVGTFCVLDLKPRKLEPEERELFRDLASLAERELNLLTQLHQQRKLTELTSHLATSLEALEMVEVLVNTLHETVSFDRAAVAVKRSQKMNVIYSSGGRLAGSVFDPGDEPVHIFTEPSGASIRLAISYKDQQLGWLWLDRERELEFSPTETVLIASFVDQVGLILENRQILVNVFEQNRLASLGSLAAGVAHEINSPLGAARLSVESALSSLSTEQVALNRKLQRVNKAIQQAGNIIRDVLRFAGEGPTPTADSELSGIAGQALALLHHELHREGIEIETDLTPRIRVAMSPNDLQTVLHHLIRNACWAVRQPNSRGRNVLLQTFLKDGKAMLTVEDMGCGIEPSISGRIFDPFFTTKQPGEGMGLGLSVSRQLVRAVGGSLDIAPSEKFSTRLELILPTENS